MASSDTELLLYVYHENVKKHYNFEDVINFDFVLLLSATQQAHRQKPPAYTAESGFSSEKVFFFFYKVRTNCDPTKPYNKSLINLVCSVCTGKYCLQFLSHRPRSFVARSVRKTSDNTFLYRPRSRLISP